MPLLYLAVAYLIFPQTIIFQMRKLRLTGDKINQEKRTRIQNRRESTPILKRGGQKQLNSEAQATHTRPKALCFSSGTDQVWRLANRTVWSSICSPHCPFIQQILILKEGLWLSQSTWLGCHQSYFFLTPLQVISLPDPFSFLTHRVPHSMKSNPQCFTCVAHNF